MEALNGSWQFISLKKGVINYGITFTDYWISG